MRNRWAYFAPIFDHLGVLFWVFALVLLLPLGVCALYARLGHAEAPSVAYVVPALVSLALAVLLKRRLSLRALDTRRAMVLCALGWILVSAVGAMPLAIGLEGVSYLDAYFESASGFTTTGITMLSGLDAMPRSILFWRALIQWLGGLGILTFFLALVFAGGSAHRLFSAESHKIFSKRVAPGLAHTLRILWAIYGLFTVLVAAALALEGMTVFDAVTHALTSLSTGGYSPHDASIAYYEEAGYRHFVLIEYTIIFGMLLGGINFFIHYRVLRVGVRALWDNFEMKLWWGLVFGATALVAADHFGRFGFDDVHRAVRDSLFQVVALITTTGFGTRDIALPYFPGVAKQVFLVLMVIGGCVGSTGGGIKVLRVGVLAKMVGRQTRRLIYGPSASNPLVVDGDVIPPEEIRRISALFFAWVGLLVAGGLVTAACSELGPLESASGMFSALGNIGPCYISVADMAALNPAVKVTYIFGMLAGRLEILPLLLLFTRRTWK